MENGASPVGIVTRKLESKPVVIQTCNDQVWFFCFWLLVYVTFLYKVAWGYSQRKLEFLVLDTGIVSKKSQFENKGRKISQKHAVKIWLRGSKNRRSWMQSEVSVIYRLHTREWKMNSPHSRPRSRPVMVSECPKNLITLSPL